MITENAILYKNKTKQQKLFKHAFKSQWAVLKKVRTFYTHDGLLDSGPPKAPNKVS